MFASFGNANTNVWYFTEIYKKMKLNIQRRRMLFSSIKGGAKLQTNDIFVSATKIGENTTNIVELLFFTINLHFVTSN